MTTRSEKLCRLGIRSLVVTAALLIGTGAADAQTERVPPVEGPGEEPPAQPAPVAPPQCPRQEILAGVIDKPPFSTANGAEPAAPSAALQAAVGGPFANFDGTALNERFVHTFRLPPCKCLVGAKLEFRAKALGSGASNDSLTLGFSTITGFPRWSARLGSSTPSPPVWLSSPEWGNAALVRTFTLDLAALPTTGGPPASPPVSPPISLLSAMQTNKYLDVYIQDDTAVDYLKLTATMCDCCQPNGRAEICISKFNDKNRNGVKEATEPGLQGWTFQANDQAGGNLVTSPPTTAAGKTCFSVLAPATYTISEVPTPGWIQTTPASPAVVTVAPGGPAVNLVFGNWFKSNDSDSR